MRAAVTGSRGSSGAGAWVMRTYPSSCIAGVMVRLFSARRRLAWSESDANRAMLRQCAPVQDPIWTPSVARAWVRSCAVKRSSAPGMVVCGEAGALKTMVAEVKGRRASAWSSRGTGMSLGAPLCAEAEEAEEARSRRAAARRNDRLPAVRSKLGMARYTEIEGKAQLRRAIRRGGAWAADPSGLEAR